jgi:hypothetical protein
MTYEIPRCKDCRTLDIANPPAESPYISRHIRDTNRERGDL